MEGEAATTTIRRGISYIDSFDQSLPETRDPPVTTRNDEETQDVHVGFLASEVARMKNRKQILQNLKELYESRSGMYDSTCELFLDSEFTLDGLDHDSVQQDGSVGQLSEVTHPSQYLSLPPAWVFWCNWLPRHYYS